jgi:hypothetical protein
MSATDPLVNAGELRQYGIRQERSDFRIHVAFGNGHVYAYPTESGVEACESGNYPAQEAHQAGVRGATSTGYRVPAHHIHGMQARPIPKDILETALAEVDRDSDTSTKGAAAMYVASEMLRRGLIPLPYSVLETTDLALQHAGVDVVATACHHIQVKCDWPAGKLGLFLQVAEANPLHRI